VDWFPEKVGLQDHAATRGYIGPPRRRRAAGEGPNVADVHAVLGVACRPVPINQALSANKEAASVGPGALTPGGGRQNQTDRIATKGKAQ